MSNRIAKVKDFVNHDAVKDNITNITNNDIRQTEFLFDYSLLTIENEEKDKLKKHEKNLLFHRKQINKATSDMGKTLTEAREVFIKSHSESFVEWYEKLGFSKDQVSVAMNRYQLTIEYPNARENIINLSDIAIKEVVNKKTPPSIKEKVLAGQIITGQQIREERKNSSIAVEKFSKAEAKNNSIAVEKFEEVEEAEIIEKRTLEGVNRHIRKIKTRINEIDLIAVEKDGLLESEIKELADIVERLNKIGVK